MRNFTHTLLLFVMYSPILIANPARADDSEGEKKESSSEYETGHRFGAGLGLAQIEDGQKTFSYFTIGGEYEYRFHSFLGAGVGVNHIFSSPNVTLFALPQAYVHPLQGSWYINLGPVLQIGGGLSAQIGFRIGTRLGITLGDVSLTPQVNVDFINGGRNYIFGIGVGL